MRGRVAEDVTMPGWTINLPSLVDKYGTSIHRIPQGVKHPYTIVPPNAEYVRFLFLVHYQITRFFLTKYAHMW